jgi:hypothetical protein
MTGVIIQIAMAKAQIRKHCMTNWLDAFALRTFLELMKKIRTTYFLSVFNECVQNYGWMHSIIASHVNYNIEG